MSPPFFCGIIRAMEIIDNNVEKKTMHPMVQSYVGEGRKHASRWNLPRLVNLAEQNEKQREIGLSFGRFEGV